MMIFFSFMFQAIRIEKKGKLNNGGNEHGIKGVIGIMNFHYSFAAGVILSGQH